MANKGLEGFPTRNAIILVVTVPKWGGGTRWGGRSGSASREIPMLSLTCDSWNLQ